MARPTTSRVSIDLAKETGLYRRQLIIRQAALLFFEKGYPAATMDDIASRLQVTKPVVYTHFASKADLLFAVCQGGMNELHFAIDRLSKLEIGPSEKLRRVVEAAAQTLMEKQPETAVFARESKHLLPSQVDAIHRSQKSFDAKLALILDEGVQAGAFDITDIGVTTLAITGMLSWMFSWYGRQRRLSDDQICRAFADLAIRMVER